MSGISKDLFGMTLEEFFNENILLGNSVEEILLEIQEKQSGYFWRLINGLPYVFFYCPIE